MRNRCVACGMLLALTGPLGAQGIVRGVVTNDRGRRLPGVELTVAGINKTVCSDSAGEYELVLAPARSEALCYVTVYLDGVLLYDRTAEFYAADAIAPAQFRDRIGLFFGHWRWVRRQTA